MFRTATIAFPAHANNLMTMLNMIYFRSPNQCFSSRIKDSCIIAQAARYYSVLRIVDFRKLVGRITVRTVILNILSFRCTYMTVSIGSINVCMNKLCNDIDGDIFFCGSILLGVNRGRARGVEIEPKLRGELLVGCGFDSAEK